VVRAVDALARRHGVSRNDTLNAIVRAYLADPEHPERFGTLLAAIATATGAAIGEAYRQEVTR
jgi:metal-responsive CopG/Arc/MetJ family transcriptional regulator